MFGKRKQDHKHRYADEASDDVVDADAPSESTDEDDLAAALLELGRNRHMPLHKPKPDDPPKPKPEDPPKPKPQDPPKPDEAVGFDPPDRPARGIWPTAAMLAEPEPEPDDRDAEAEPAAAGPGATHGARRRERAEPAGQDDAALQRANAEIAALQAELKTLRTAAAKTEVGDDRAATARTAELEQSLRDSRARVEQLTAEVERLRSTGRGRRSHAPQLESNVSTLTADLERARSEAAAAGVALARVEREAKDHEGAVAAAEERADRLAAEIEQLRAAMAKGPAQVERLQREAERERTMRAALEQAQASQAQAEAALADNLRLAKALSNNLQSQEGLIAALTGLQAEITEQRAWFEAQIERAGEAEGEQARVIEKLQAAIQDRDAEVEVLRQHLLEAETKRAEEAAAFVAALERQ